jgi:hypothetical protein
MKLATCHPAQPHYAKGLCRKCYQGAYHKVYDAQRWRPAKGDPLDATNPHESLFRVVTRRAFGVFAVASGGGHMHNGAWRHL